MQLRTKLLLPLASFTVLLAAYLYGYWMPTSLQALRDDYRVASERQMDSIIEGLIPLLLARQLDTVYENLDGVLRRNHDWIAVRLDDAGGKSIYPLSGGIPPLGNENNLHELKRPIDYLGTHLGNLTVTVDYTPWLQRARSRQQELATAVFIALLAFFICAGYILERVVVRPVNALRLAASELAQNRYPAHLEKSGDDEVGDLVDRFSEMRDAIRGYQTELLERSGVLQASERSLAEAQRMAHLGSWEQAAAGAKAESSAEVFRILGTEPAGDVGVSAVPPEIVHPEDRSRVEAAHTRLESGEGNCDIVYRIVRRSDGRVRNVREIAELTRDAAGQFLHSRGTLHDITELVQAEEEVRRLNRELEQRVRERTAQLEAANKELEAFAYSVSHDLRAPLRHISGFVALLGDKLGSGADDEARHFMATITDAAQHMGALIDDLLSFSRMGRQDMASARVDLAALARDVVGELKAGNPARDIDWRIGELPVVIGDRAMLRMVLVNLLSNAVKFTQKKPQAQIEIGCKSTTPEVVIFVRDNGVGFDMKQADKLFGVFQRLHAASDFEGTGIGLANVRRIVSRHGGRTWAEGRVDEGACFFFSLPAVSPASSAGETA